MGGTSFESYRQAYLLFRKLTKSPANKNTLCRFHEFIDAGSYKRILMDDFLSDVALRRIKLLAGPDGEVYFRIIKAQQDDDDKGA